MRLFLLLLVVALASGLVVGDEECLRRPPLSVTRSPKSPGDNGFKILISGDTERYTPGGSYTVTLVGSRTHHRLQQFTRFSLSAEPRDPTAESTPLTHGQFQLFADTLSTFDERCVNTIKEADDFPKTEVQVMWKAPRAGSGCVVIRAMVFESARRWYSEDGQLSRQICEEVARDAASVDKDECCACDDAKYQMIFEGIWSNKTHPKDFPISLSLTHFSDVIGASHEKNFSFWGEGQIASDGFRSLAEYGIVRILEQELRQQGKHLKTIIKAAGLWYPDVNTNTTGAFSVDRKKHLVSVASMLGPTPDWVVGVSGLDLCKKDCTWVDKMTIDLYPYDAGTDSGVTYMSPNSETKPRERMFPITTKYPEDPRAPFFNMHSDVMVPLARLYLTRQRIIPRGCDESLLRELALEVAENTEDVERPECGVTEYSSWSACSVTCGKGLRMRTRQYTMPAEKVRMLGCARQLVSKEMCVADVAECGETPDLEGEITSDVSDELCRTGEWGPWSACSETCGAGQRMRTRHFLNPMGRKKCTHITTVEKEKCMESACVDGSAPDTDPACPVSPWSEWSPCSATCGPGARVRVRLLLDAPAQCEDRVTLTQRAPCTEREDCALDMATAKVVCMEPADPGLCRGSYERWAFNTQKAMCVPFTYNGCKGNRNNFLTEQECNNACGIVREILLGGAPSGGSLSPPLVAGRSPAARRDCILSEWSPWSACSVSCGTGYATRFRMVKVEAANGGIPCSRNLNKRQRCYGPPCR